MNSEANQNSAIATDDFSREQVPQEKTFSGLHIALVMVGGTIGIPVFLMAAQIGSSIGLAQTIPAFFMGSLVLGIMVGLTSYVGAKTHYSTYMITEFAFGRQGAKLANLVVAMALIGWYGVISNVFAQASDLALREAFGWSVPIWIHVLIGSLLMIGVTISGFKGLDKLAMMLVPIMLIFLFYTAWLSLKGSDIDIWSALGTDANFTFSSAVSAVIGSYIVGVVIQPDYSRFARNVRHAIVAAFMALGVCFPLVMILCAIPSIATAQGDLIQIMIALGVGVPAFLLVLLSSWSSNVLNLYSSSLSMATIYTRARLWKIILGLGIIGTSIAFMKAQTFFVTYLILLGITIPPIASIYILNALWVRKANLDIEHLQSEAIISWRAFTAWIIAAGVGYFSHIGVLSLTTVAGLDSIFVSTIIYIILNLGFFKPGAQV